MDARMVRRIDDAAATLERIRAAHSWETSYLQHFAALAFTVGPRPYDKEAVRALMARIRGTFGFFSTYRSAAFLLATLLLALSEDPDRALDRLAALAPILREERVRSYSYEPLLAAVLVRSGGMHELAAKVERTKEVYEELRRDHPFLTGSDDYPLAALLAVAEGPLAPKLADVSSLYFLLHLKGLSKGNGLQLLSLILAPGGETPVRKAERVADLQARLRDLGIRVWPQHYGALGLLALLPDPDGTAAARAAGTVEALRLRKHYRMLDKGLLLLFAGILLADDATAGEAPLAAGVVLEALIQAQTAALVAATAAATSAASAASAGA